MKKINKEDRMKEVERFSNIIEDELDKAIEAFVTQHLLSCKAVLNEFKNDFERFSTPDDLTKEYIKCLKCEKISTLIEIDFLENGKVKIRGLRLK
jgi:predicted phage-related endonuclease